MVDYTSYRGLSQPRSGPLVLDPPKMRGRNHGPAAQDIIHDISKRSVAQVVGRRPAAVQAVGWSEHTFSSFRLQALKDFYCVQLTSHPSCAFIHSS